MNASCRVVPVPGTQPLVLLVVGELDSWTTRSVMREVVRTCVHQPVRLDLSGVTFFGAAGVAMLVRLRTLAVDRVELIRVNPCVEHVLELCDRGDLAPARRLTSVPTGHAVTFAGDGRRAAGPPQAG